MVAIFCVIFIARRNSLINMFGVDNQFPLITLSLEFVTLGENERRARSRLDAWNGRGFLPNLLRR